MGAAYKLSMWRACGTVDCTLNCEVQVGSLLSGASGRKGILRIRTIAPSFDPHAHRGFVATSSSWLRLTGLKAALSRRAHTIFLSGST